MPLDEYWQKRDFAKTSEPRGSHAAFTSDDQPLRYVIQMHDASRLHYDFRLEHDGVLYSWAVPRGPSLSPTDRRLAVRTEDHPIEYGDFEGTIPEEEYGGGTVALWDIGTWEPVPHKSITAMMAAGKLEFVLHGDRLRGLWVLVRIKDKKTDDDSNWLLIKMKDEHAREDGEALVRDATTSVTSGRTLPQIAAGSAVWHSNKGVGVTASVRGGRARVSIGSDDVSARYPEIVRVLERLGADAIIDGLVFHRDGRHMLVAQALRELDGDTLSGYSDAARRAALGLLLDGSDLDPTIVGLA